MSLFIGDVRDGLRTFAPGSVQTCVTSPPYWGLRDYGTAQWDGGDSECDHVEMSIGMSDANTLGPLGFLPATNAANVGRVRQYRNVCGKCGAKRIDRQLGLEPTIAEYVANMVEVFRLVRDVLADDGTLWLNLGDSYNSGTQFNHHSSGLSGGARYSEGECGDWPGHRAVISDGLKPKDLCGIPWRVAFALQADGWWLRSDIIWAKPNPMPESVTDRPTKSHEYLFLLSKRGMYYYDADAIAENGVTGDLRRPYTSNGAWALDGRAPDQRHGGEQRDTADATRNKRSVWTVTTQPYADAHFATFPPKLIEPCIMAGTSQRGHCPECGKGWERVVERETVRQRADAAGTWQERPAADGYGKAANTTQRRDRTSGLSASNSHNDSTPQSPTAKMLGWQPTCTCNAGDPVPGLVLDPFMGSGTVAQVAQALGRKWLGCELNPDYAKMIEQRTAQQGMAFA